MENYIVVTWPESQSLMDYDWFEEECNLINTEPLLSVYGGSAYFVPLNRYNEILKDENGYVRIMNKSESSYIDLDLSNGLEVLAFDIKLSEKDRLVRKHDTDIEAEIYRILTAINSGYEYFNEEEERVKLYASEHGLNDSRLIDFIAVVKEIDNDANIIGHHNLAYIFLNN